MSRIRTRHAFKQATRTEQATNEPGVRTIGGVAVAARIEHTDQGEEIRRPIPTGPLQIRPRGTIAEQMARAKRVDDLVAQIDRANEHRRNGRPHRQTSDDRRKVQHLRRMS